MKKKKRRKIKRDERVKERERVKHFGKRMKKRKNDQLKRMGKIWAD